MKYKVIAISIASSLISLSAANVFADSNEMIVNQNNSAGTVILNQGTAGGGLLQGATTNSKITVIQDTVDNGTRVLVDQINANDVEVNVKQYEGEGSDVVIQQAGGVAAGGAGGPGGADRNIVNIQQGDSTVAGSNRRNSFNVNTQTGSGNNIVGYQGTDPTLATQMGEDNTALLQQNGHSSRIGFNQSGTNNTANATQAMGSLNNQMDISQAGVSSSVLNATQASSTQDSTMDVIADGSDNKVLVTQGDGAALNNSSINININGNNNNIGDATHKVQQLSSESKIDIAINGDNNAANLSQEHGSDHSEMTLSQGGDNNTAEMKQVGDHNEMSLTQNITGGTLLNNATLNQNSFKDKMTVTQINGGTAILTQN
ncbi:MAG: hypothetical protein KAH03_00195 [Cocleimonas sp.]|nr:hypothetical protein [Cocleimonas sp.]